MRDDNESVVRAFYAQGASGELDDQLLAEDLLYHGPAFLGPVNGREGFKQLLGGLRQGFPGFETTIEDLIVEGDLAAVRHTHHAVHRGEFNGLPPTGRTIAVSGIEILRLRDGQIVEFWHMDDFLGLLQQLGVVPAAEAVSGA